MISTCKKILQFSSVDKKIIFCCIFVIRIIWVKLHSIDKTFMELSCRILAKWIYKQNIHRRRGVAVTESIFWKQDTLSHGWFPLNSLTPLIQNIFWVQSSLCSSYESKFKPSHGNTILDFGNEISKYSQGSISKFKYV